MWELCAEVCDDVGFGVFHDDGIGKEEREVAEIRTTAVSLYWFLCGLFTKGAMGLRLL